MSLQVDAHVVTDFTWDYVQRQPALKKLYEKGKTSQWNASTDIDWSPEVNFGEPIEHEFGEDFLEQFMPDSPVTRMGDEGRTMMAWEFQSWMVSQFMHGEQGALVATARLVETVPEIDSKFYAANQVADEARHVAFGVLSLQGLYPEMSAAELKEREEFIMQAAQLMHDRFLLEQVWERVGVDVEEGKAYANTNPLMMVFRQMLFSKIVPNLRKLGLLTDPVRQQFERLDIIHFETQPDSATEFDPQLTEAAS